MKLSIKNIVRGGSAGFVTAALLWAPRMVSAQGKLIPDCAKDTSINSAPSLDCALETFTSIARFLFGIMGSAALLMFVIGGFFILASAGRETWVKKGKEYVKNAIIGIAIILTSAYLIEYGVGVLRQKDVGSSAGGKAEPCAGESYRGKNDEIICCPGEVISAPPPENFACAPK